MGSVHGVLGLIVTPFKRYLIKKSFQDINDNNNGIRMNNNYEVSPWLVSPEIVQATKEPPILRKSVITTQL